MKSSSARLESDGLIDRRKALNFKFNGKALTGYRGDTLASALIANGIMLTARSFRYHRPRGIFSAGVEECHAIVCIGEGHSREPNVRATQQVLYDGLIATSQNAWPTLRWDLGALTGWVSRFLPVGFYYKTFQWPAWKWHENWVRRMAGVAPAPVGTDTDQYDKRHAHCDLLIIGAGPTGLAAAVAASNDGRRIILADDQAEPGGSLIWNRERVAYIAGIDWARHVSNQLASKPNITLLTRTTVVAAWDHGYFSARQQVDPHRAGRVSQRLWKIRAQQTILASGAIERPLVFPNNDRPGIMLAAAACQYVNRYAVLPGKRAVIFTNNDSAYQTALQLQDAGGTVAVVDVRESISEDLRRRVSDTGIRIYVGHEIFDTQGYFRLRSIDIRPRRNSTAKTDRHLTLNCDLLCISGGWNPTLHLFSQAGGKLDYAKKLACFIPHKKQASRAANIRPAGSAAGHFNLAKCLESGQRAVQDAAIKATVNTAEPVATFNISDYWQTPPPCRGRQWVDQLHDVTASAVDVAVREGFASVEHLKRYTTIGMAVDQGKTSNVNTLGILGQLTGQSIGETGTTTFRPPFTPISLGVLAGREIGSRAWPMRRLPLHEWHAAASGQMEDHSGWYRPAFYKSSGESEHDAIAREVLATRNGVTLFDSSSLGKIEVSGPDAEQFLNRMYINNVATLKTGRVRYGMMLNENGIITDDGVFARLQDDFFLVSSSSAGTAQVALGFEEWLQTEWPELDVLVHNATTQWATLTVGGPKSRAVIGALLPSVELSALQFPHMSALEGDIDGVPYRLMRVSFTGETSFELSVPANFALTAWKKLLAIGQDFNIMPLGMEALEILRTEKGFLEVGVDTDVSTSPLDVGWAVPIARKTVDFVGKRSLSRPNDRRPDRPQLVGLRPADPRQLVPVGAHVVARKDGMPEGHVTSSCISPTLGFSIAMALLKAGQSRLGEHIEIDVDAQLVPAEVVPLAFYDPKGERLHA